MEEAGLPFAPIRKPEDLYDDEHLLATGGLADVRLPDGPKAGQTVKTTLFPITMDGQRLGVRLDPPRLGEHSRDLLAGAGLCRELISTSCWRGPSWPEAGHPNFHGDKIMSQRVASLSRRDALLALAALAAGAAGLSPQPVFAQSDRPVRFILPSATGSGVDTITRATSPAVSKALGHPVVVENQAGAGGVIGTQAMIKSPPDGNTLSVVSNNHVIYPSVLKSVPFDPVKDITAITVIGTTPMVLVVNPQGARQQREGVDRAAEGEAGVGQLCLVRQRHHPAPGG